MIEQEAINFIGYIFLTIGAAIMTACVLVHARTDWRATQMGKHVMYFMSSLALTLDLGVIRWMFGDSEWFQWLRLFTLLLVLLTMTQRLYLLVEAQQPEGWRWRWSWRRKAKNQS